MTSFLTWTRSVLLLFIYISSVTQIAGDHSVEHLQASTSNIEDGMEPKIEEELAKNLLIVETMYQQLEHEIYNIDQLENNLNETKSLEILNIDVPRQTTTLISTEFLNNAMRSSENLLELGNTTQYAFNNIAFLSRYIPDKNRQQTLSFDAISLNGLKNANILIYTGKFMMSTIETVKQMNQVIQPWKGNFKNLGRIFYNNKKTALAIATLDYVLRRALYFLLRTVTEMNLILHMSIRLIPMLKFNEICYRVLGCFSLMPPWASLLRPVPLPQNPEAIDTKFTLFTRNTKYDVIKLPYIDMTGSGYEGGKMTYFLCHGYKGDGEDDWMIELKDAILESFDANVFIVDWSRGANTWIYRQAASNVRIVGAEMARLGKYLIEYMDARASRFHLIGFSLGAHAASYMAKEIPNIAQITALDPAQPYFENKDKSVRLDKSDADFVMVIHTSSRPFITALGLGMIKPCGHVDFYVNGGARQPGCSTDFRTLIAKKNPINLLTGTYTDIVDRRVSCHHRRAYEVFIESFTDKNCIFWGHKYENKQEQMKIEAGLRKGHCNEADCIPLSVDAINYPARGVFYVTTRSSHSFCDPDTEADKKMINLNSTYSSHYLRYLINNQLKHIQLLFQLEQQHQQEQPLQLEHQHQQPLQLQHDQNNTPLLISHHLKRSVRSAINNTNIGTRNMSNNIAVNNTSSNDTNNDNRKRVIKCGRRFMC